MTAVVKGDEAGASWARMPQILRCTVDEDIVRPLEGDGVTEGFQARGQSVAHGQCARMDDPAESVSV